MSKVNGTIRRAVRGDLQALVALEALFPGDRLSAASFHHLLARGHADLWVYELAGEIRADAVVLYRRRSKRARLYSLITHPDYRACGCAGQLLALAENAAHQRGCTQIGLEVRADNDIARGLYERRGYRPCKLLAGFYDDGTSALRMEKSLTNLRSAKAVAGNEASHRQHVTIPPGSS